MAGEETAEPGFTFTAFAVGPEFSPYRFSQHSLCCALAKLDL